MHRVLALCAGIALWIITPGAGPLAPSSLLAQSVETVPPGSSVAGQFVADRIVAAPQADTLRPIWTVQPDSNGCVIQALGDIFQTGHGVWAVNFWSVNEWRFYRHDSGEIAADTIPFTTLKYDRYPRPVLGSFWGAGRKGILLSQQINHTSELSTITVDAFRVDSSSIADRPATTMNTKDLQIGGPWMTAFAAADLDEDGADEAILMIWKTYNDTGDTYAPEVWIFKGGPDFSLKTPTIVLRAQKDSGAVSYVKVGDFDGDRHQDILIAKSGLLNTNSTSPRRMHFYWGTGELEGFRDARNHRTVEFGENHPIYAYTVQVLDCDGDGVRDLAFSHKANTSSDGLYIYRSGGKGPGDSRNARTRSFTRDDADIRLLTASYLEMQPGGTLNDRSRRFDMMALKKYTPGDPHASVVLISGGIDGPDSTYEAYINQPESAVFPTFDVDGDGWDDLLAEGYYAGHNLPTHVVIYGGGPHIPSPKVSGVEVISAQGHTRMHQQGITLWPNPVEEELHIAWRGDLDRMPRSFRVHDTYGREVARGDARAGSGHMTWQCDGLPGGAYLVSIADVDGAHIVTRAILKRE